MAYETATPQIKESQPDGSVRVVFVFAGTGVPSVSKDVFVVPGTTPAALQTNLRSQIKGLNDLQTTIGAISKGVAMDVSAPAVVSIASDTFLGAVKSYNGAVKALSLGLVNQAAVDAALSAVKSAYQPGFENYLG